MLQYLARTDIIITCAINTTVIINTYYREIVAYCARALFYHVNAQEKEAEIESTVQGSSP